MQKGKSSNPQSAGVATGRQLPQNTRGPTPPQQRGQEADFQQRNPQGHPFSNMQMQTPGAPQHIITVPPLGMQHQPSFTGQPRMQGGHQQFYPPPGRPMRVRPSHQPPQQNPMYSSPPTGHMMQFVSPQGGPAFIPQQQQYVQTQNEYNPAQVVGGQLQFRQVVPQQVPGQFASMPSPAFSQQQSPYGMPQTTLYTQPQQPFYIFKTPQTPVSLPQQQPPRPPEQKRERKIIQIKDPNQDNRDITQEILMSVAHSGSGTPNSTPDASGRSSNSNTPPVNSHIDAGAQFAAQVAATLANDKPSSNKSSPQTSKPASPAVTTEVAVPLQHNESKLVETSRGSVVAVKVKQAIVQHETKVEKKPQQPPSAAVVLKPAIEVAPAVKEVTVSEITKSPTEVKQDEVILTESKLVESMPAELKATDFTPEESIPAESIKTTDTKPAIAVASDVEKVTEPDAKELSAEPEQRQQAAEKLVSNGLTTNVEATPSVVTKQDTQITDISKVPPSETVADSEKITAEVEKPKQISTEESIAQDTVSELSTLPDEQKVNGHEHQPMSGGTAPEPTRAAAESQMSMKDAPKKKKKQRIKDFDKKERAMDLMDAYTERPVKEEVAVPVEDKEISKSDEKVASPPVEDQTPVEEKSWEDKEDLLDEETPEVEEVGIDDIEAEEVGIDDMEAEVEVPDRKLTYDRDFLLKFQFEEVCKEKPEGLPDIEVVLDTARPPQKVFANNRMQGADFTPTWMKIGRPGQNQQHNIQQGRRKVPPKKIILPAPTQEVKQLKRSENAWVRPKGQERETSDQAKTEDLYRKLISILNKLTPQKFQTLTNQILELEIDTPERLEGVIDRIFEKAIGEPGFSVAYANMCRCLMAIKVKVQMEGKDGKEAHVSFRKILLNKCQKEFEKEKSEENLVHAKMDALAQQGLKEDELKMKKAELDVEEINMRRRSLGNIRFIGELFKLKMLTENIMHDCVVKLLRSTDEESYECLCKLLSTIGKDLDHEKAKPRVDQYFDQIYKIVQSKRTSSRVRFMMIDVVDLRKSNWIPRREDNNPKTIDQIHKEAQEQEKKTTIMIQQAKLQKRDNRGGRDSPRNVGVPQADDGWTSVAKGGAKNVNFDPKKFQNISKQRTVDEGNISLGPGGRGYGSWARGSSGGTGPGNTPSAGGTGEQPANRYSALLSQGDTRRTQGSTRQPGAGRQEARSPVPPGAAGKRGPMLSEREKALEAVRRQTSREAPSRPAVERTSSRPGPESVEPVTEPETRVSPPVQELTENEVREKAEATIKEFHNIRDVKEAVQCFKDVKSPSMSYVFVSAALENTIEKRTSDRRATGELLSVLLKDGLLTVEEFVKGVDQILEFAEDMEIDVPHIWKYFGELVGSPVAEGHLPIRTLGDSATKMQKISAYKMLTEVLLIAVNYSNEEKVSSLWVNSGLQWSTFFASEDQAKDFLQDKKLEFTLKGSGTKNSASSHQAQHTSRIQEELRELILKRKARNQEVFEWIDKNVEATNTKQAPFIRDLVTAVCEASVTRDSSSTSCKCDQDLLKSRKNLLQKYIDGDSKLELQALYALQSLFVALDHPPGFLKSFFDTLYDEEIISEDSFYSWERSEDSAEDRGKGLAQRSTTEFFRWLRSAPEESCEEN